jgi:regulator of replication initiation timing
MEKLKKERETMVQEKTQQLIPMTPIMMSTASGQPPRVLTQDEVVDILKQLTAQVKQLETEKSLLQTEFVKLQAENSLLRNENKQLKEMVSNAATTNATTTNATTTNATTTNAATTNATTTNATTTKEPVECTVIDQQNKPQHRHEYLIDQLQFTGNIISLSNV